ncbi:MAG: hypothetical protein IJC88_04935 [Oscillospiraceae bacterium]|nr:hypothetical protein [Oscillospiraceae bacterium]
MGLSEFLRENVGTYPEKTVKLSERLGEFTVRALSADEDAALRARCTVRIADGRGGSFPEVDPNRYLLAVAAESVVYPDLSSVELQDSYHTIGREDTLVAMLMKPEFDRLCEFLTVEGFAELVDRAKK